MRWVKKWSISPIHNKLKNGNFKFGAKDEIFKFEASPFHSVDQCRFHTLSSNMIPNNKSSMKPSKAIIQQNSMTFVCSYGRPPVRDEPSLTREWFVQLWLMERRMKASLGKKKGVVQHVRSQGGLEEVGIRQEGPLHQPPISQSITGLLMTESPEEMKMAPLLARANLLITRDIEWANIMFGFEQENRYAVVDASYPQSPVGYIREQSNLIFRQLLRTRRPFIAHISDALGNELFRVRRPFWLINSSIYVEIDGKEVGVVHRRWHLWRRVYDLYVGYKQFAVVENPGFWNWTFTLKDDKDDVLAQIDRDWRGFGLEVFTDAGLYVIRFGNVDPRSRVGLAAQIEELEVVRPLTLSERAVAVALAVSLDNDYFSRSGGWGLPFLIATE